MTAPLCKCGCGEALVKHPYETLRQWEKRLASGYFRPKCKKNAPAKPPRQLPPLGPPVSWCHEVREGEAKTKEKTPRDEAFRDFVRTFDCCECGWPAHLGGIEAHHIKTGGTSIKCSDYLEVPLCSVKARGCHAKADKSPESYEKYLPVALMLQTLWTKAGHKIKRGVKIDAIIKAKIVV